MAHFFRSQCATIMRWQLVADKVIVLRVLSVQQQSKDNLRPEVLGHDGFKWHGGCIKADDIFY